MRTGINCLTKDLFSLLLSCCIFSFFSFFLCLSFFLLCDLLFFCSSSVFSNFDIFALTFLLFAPAHYLAVLVLSLMISASFFFQNCPIFLHSITFFFFAFSLAHFPFCSFLFFFSGLFLSFFSDFDSIFVSYCFSYSGFLMFLWFLLYCILSVFSSLIYFDFSFSSSS